MQFFLATKNKHKLVEFKRILSDLNFDVICESDLDFSLKETEETGATFEENAFLKANAAMKATGLPSIADDSGLCVDYLDGAPGIYSARFAGEPVDNDKNNQKLLDLLKGVKQENRTAKFVCSIVCVFPDGSKLSAKGECSGYIAEEKRGNKGFGYDPLFVSPVGCFGCISDEEKDSISHRGRALVNFSKVLCEYMKED